MPPQTAGSTSRSPVSTAYVLGDAIEALTVVPATTGTGWTTTGVRIRTYTTTPAPVTNELILGTARTSINCA